MASHSLPFRTRTIGGRSFELIDWSHPAVESRVLREMEEGFAVYYDREWPLTIRFCEFLLSQSSILRGRRILVAGAGVGPEAVVAGWLGRSLWINDISAAALELLAIQLVANGVEEFDVVAGTLAEIPIPAELDLVMASFIVYDRDTLEAMRRLLDRAAARSLPVLLANQEIGGFFARLLREAPLPAEEIHRDEELRVVLWAPGTNPSTPA